MNKSIFLLVINLLILASCEKSGPCSILEDGIYRFPDLPENSNMISEEITHYFELPEDVRTCISTRGLLESCLHYPQWKILLPDPPGPQSYFLYAVDPTPQEWFENRFRAQFNGLRELESRSDYPSQLMLQYLNFEVLDYPTDWDNKQGWHHLLYIAKLEMMIGQYENLANLDKEEKKKLIKKARMNYLNKSKVDVICIDKGQSFSMALIARMMYADDFESMLTIYNENPDVKQLVDHLSLVKLSTLQEVDDLIDAYFIMLENK